MLEFSPDITFQIPSDINYNQFYKTCKLFLYFLILIMRMERLELSRKFSLDSKSSASTNYATSAYTFHLFKDKPTIVNKYIILAQIYKKLKLDLL